MAITKTRMAALKIVSSMPIKRRPLWLDCWSLRWVDRLVRGFGEVDRSFSKHALLYRVGSGCGGECP